MEEFSTSSATPPWPRTSGQVLASRDTPSHSSPHSPRQSGLLGQLQGEQEGTVKLHAHGHGGAGAGAGPPRPQPGPRWQCPRRGVVLLVQRLWATAAADASVTCPSRGPSEEPSALSETTFTSRLGRPQTPW